MTQHHLMEGLLVRLLTGSNPLSGTDDHLYVGVLGRGGGREFPLDVRGFNDFERGTDIKYWIGEVWDGSVLDGAKKPYQTGLGERNHPAQHPIVLDKIDYVYVRKEGAGGDDDAWEMNRVVVTLYGVHPFERTFQRDGKLWLSNQHGLQFWLVELFK